MKKFLLTLVAMFTLAFAGFAQASFDFKTNAYDLPNDGNTYVTNGTSITADATSPVSVTLNADKVQAWRMWSDGLRAYGGSTKKPTMTIACNGGTITKVVITTKANAKWSAATGTVDPATAAKEVTWTGSEASVKLNYDNTNTVAIETLTITYTGGSEVAVATPTISVDKNTVTLACATEGASIYYTTDGTEPSNASDEYKAPFEITKSCTVKAIAYKGADKSSVAEKPVTYVGSYANYAAFMASNPAEGADAIITGTVTAIYQNGANLYTKDSEGNYMLLFNQSGFAAGLTQNGSQIAGVDGIYSPYNNLPEIKVTDINVSGQGAAVEPEEVAVEELSLEQLNRYVKLVDVTISATTANRQGTISDATGEVAWFNNFSSANASQNKTAVEVPEGKGTVIAFVSCFKTTLQVQPVEVILTTSAVEAPVFSVAAGEVAKGTEVAISCATEGATIFYTTDGTEPTVASTEYTAPIVINDAMTIKAIAVKEGLVNSEVVTAAYTLIPEGQHEATFVFYGDNANVKTLTSATVEPSNGTAEDATNNLNGVRFYNGPVAMWIEKGESANAPRWWTDGEVRLYKDNVLKISIKENGYKIASVDLAKASSSTFAIKAENITPTGGTLDGRKWTPAAGTICTDVTIAIPGASRLGSVNVAYVEDPAATSGVESIVTDNTDAPVEYYNLQGVRVENPSAGLYIRRQGNTATKVLVK